MITKELEAFVYTAQIGSFQKASEQLFISSTALIKRINTLEEEIGITLFNRTNKGLTLTAEGKTFYNVAIDVLHRYYTGLQAAKEMSAQQKNPIRIGISQINPYREFSWKSSYGVDHFPEFTYYVMPISSEFQDFTNELLNLGGNVDMIPFFLGNGNIDSICNTFCLARLPMRIAVPADHPLAVKESLTFDDLNGFDLVSISSDVNCYYKAFNSTILEKAPRVRLRYANYYDFMTLNYAVHDNQLMLVGDYMKSVHPLLKLLPVHWDLLLPYGLHYSKKPTHTIESFIQSFIRAGLTGRPEDAPIVEF